MWLARGARVQRRERVRVGNAVDRVCRVSVCTANGHFPPPLPLPLRLTVVVVLIRVCNDIIIIVTSHSCGVRATAMHADSRNSTDPCVYPKGYFIHFAVHTAAAPLTSRHTPSQEPCVTQSLSLSFSRSPTLSLCLLFCVFPLLPIHFFFVRTASAQSTIRTVFHCCAMPSRSAWRVCEFRRCVLRSVVFIFFRSPCRTYAFSLHKTVMA